jgi:serine/threonine protein kinase
MIAFLQHRIGELIDERYEAQRVLGSGAFGTVYLCRDRELDTLVAIKELHVLDDLDTGVDEREAALAQFRREAVNLSRLRHPHIVSGHYEPQNGAWLTCPVCGYTFKGTPRCPEHNAEPIVVRQRHYLVMEYLDGPDLAEAAEAAGGLLPIPQALRYIRQIAEALGLIHARGLVHRDIKPENIRLRADPGTAGDDAVLLDFGIATASGEFGDYSTRVQRHTTGGGTFGYAPESPQERRFPDARSDIHALGMTLYRLVSGFDPLVDADLLEMRRREPRELNSAIPTGLESLILASISPDPDDRPVDAADFLGALGEAVAPAKPMAMAPSAVAPATMASGGVVPAPSYAPVPEFVFRSGERAQTVQELVFLMDKNRQEATSYLYEGDFAAWLTRLGRADLAQRAREIPIQYPDRRYQGLEALVQSTGLAAPPALEITPRHLDFGTVSERDQRTLTLKLRNVGRGHLFGLLRSGDAGLVFDDAFEGNSHQLKITLDARGLPRGHYNAELVVDSSAGEMRVPVTAEIQSSGTGSATISVFFWAFLGMVCGTALRVLPFLDELDDIRVLTEIPFVGGSFIISMVFGFVVWAILFLLTFAEATRRKSWSFFFASGFAAIPVALLCATGAIPLLKAGDEALRPLMPPMLHGWTVGSWAIAGAFAGACYGTLRHLNDVFSKRLLSVLLGWLLVLAVVYGFLLGANTPMLFR